jgi:hypothetical protein
MVSSDGRKFKNPMPFHSEPAKLAEEDDEVRTFSAVFAGSAWERL